MAHCKEPAEYMPWAFSWGQVKEAEQNLVDANKMLDAAVEALYDAAVIASNA